MPALEDYLGELTNELDDDDYITTFVSGGPKNFAYQTKNGKTTCKVKGFTLNLRGSQKLNFSTMCAHVCNPNEQPTFLKNPHFIKRDAKTKTIHTVNLKKRYKLVYDKRVFHGFTTLPYGYRWLYRSLPEPAIWNGHSVEDRDGYKGRFGGHLQLITPWTVNMNRLYFSWCVAALKHLYNVPLFQSFPLTIGWIFWMK